MQSKTMMHISNSIRNSIPITLAVLKPGNASEHDIRTTVDENAFGLGFLGTFSPDPRGRCWIGQCHRKLGSSWEGSQANQGIRGSGRLGTQWSNERALWDFY